ncbi:MAG: hypothetical protein K6T16_02305 [Candidatus Pacearchaeota archaeon]|nr:hypothetical protein [Candidatus Pacearchaeota archaeon]
MRLFDLIKNNKNRKKIERTESGAEILEKTIEINQEPIDFVTLVGIEAVPVKKFVFIYDNGLDNSPEAELVKRRLRKQREISLHTISTKETYKAFMALKLTGSKEAVIIKGEYDELFSDREIEEFANKLRDSDSISVTYKHLRFRDESRKGLDIRGVVRSYMADFNRKVNGQEKQNLEEKIKIEEGADVLKLERPSETEVPEQIEPPKQNYEDFVQTVLDEREKEFDNLAYIDLPKKIEIPASPAPPGASVENVSIEKIEKPNIEGFLTDEEMGLKSNIPCTIAISESCRNKISLNYDELRRLILAIPYAWKKMFPWCDVEVNTEDCIRVGDRVGELVDAVSFKLKEKGSNKYTGDVIKANKEVFVIWKNGKEYYAKPTEQIAPLLVALAKRGEFEEDELRYHVDQIVEQIAERYTKKKGVTIEQIIEEKGKDAKEFECKPGVAYVDFSEMFVKEITACIEDIAEKKGGLAGLAATEEYKAPDSNNAGEVSLRFESEPFTKFYEAYPKIKEREKTIINYNYGRQIIHALVEAYNNVEIRKNRLDGIKAMINAVPSSIDKKIIISVFEDLKNKAQLDQINQAQSNQSDKSKNI